MDIVKVLSNPIRMQVMQYLQTYGEATTKQISESLKDIPTPTLYRHINVMVKEEVLLIKEERKVRGSLERLLTINYEKMSSTLHSNIADTSYKFLMELYMHIQIVKWGSWEPFHSIREECHHLGREERKTSEQL